MTFTNKNPSPIFGMFVQRPLSELGFSDEKNPGVEVHGYIGAHDRPSLVPPLLLTRTRSHNSE